MVALTHSDSLTNLGKRAAVLRGRGEWEPSSARLFELQTPGVPNSGVDESADPRA